MSVNKVILVGNVGKDPEIRRLDNDIAVAEFTLATTERSYTMKNGNQIPERTEWHNIKAWRGLAELSEKWIKKGQQLYIEGKIQTRSWEKDGIKRYATDIVADVIQLLGRKADNSESTYQAPVSVADAPPASEPIDTPPATSDDLPF
ncbi:MAG: single-stranded DNA-binding protein [Paludibacter sp.]|jgi:single-strand DNA-binding protein|nr:single-stranded DNA-binding protein [Paludibacter sp.]